MFELLLGAPIAVSALLVAYEVGVPVIKNKIDIATKGKFSKLADTYNTILASLETKPDEWLFRTNSARFPKDGNAGQIFIQLENGKVMVSIDSVNSGNEERVKGFFEKKFIEVLDTQYRKVAFAASVRKLFPEKEHLLLENYSK